MVALPEGRVGKARAIEIMSAHCIWLLVSFLAVGLFVCLTSCCSGLKHHGVMGGLFSAFQAARVSPCMVKCAQEYSHLPENISHCSSWEALAENSEVAV